MEPAASHTAFQAARRALDREPLFTKPPLTSIGLPMAFRSRRRPLRPPCDLPRGGQTDDIPAARGVPVPSRRCAGPALVLLSTLLCSAVACRSVASDLPSPDPTLAAYTAALQRDDPDAAYALLAPSVQATLSRADFQQQWRNSAVERAWQLQQLKAGSRPPRHNASDATPAPQAAGVVLTRQAQLTIPTETSPTGQLRLTDDGDGRFRIAQPELVVQPATTPEQALRLFADALERRSFSAVLHMLSPATRNAVEAELRERLDRLHSALDHLPTRASVPAAPLAEGTPTSRRTPPPAAPAASPLPAAPTLDVQGDRARLQYDPRFFIDLIRDKDGWHIRDMN